MTRTKAIEILSNNGLCPHGTTWGEYLEATKMGAAALSIVDNILVRFPTLMPKLLPEEDPETNSKRSLHHIKQVLEGNEVSK